eukprot:31439-Pelagococcus_subviridis.AAC.7
MRSTPWFSFARTAAARRLVLAEIFGANVSSGSSLGSVFGRDAYSRSNSVTAWSFESRGHRRGFVISGSFGFDGPPMFHLKCPKNEEPNAARGPAVGALVLEDSRAPPSTVALGEPRRDPEAPPRFASSCRFDASMSPANVFAIPVGDPPPPAPAPASSSIESIFETRARADDASADDDARASRDGVPPPPPIVVFAASSSAIFASAVASSYVSRSSASSSSSATSECCDSRCALCSLSLARMSFVSSGCVLRLFARTLPSICPAFLWTTGRRGEGVREEAGRLVALRRPN